MQLPILISLETADLMCLASQLSEPEVEWKGEKKTCRSKAGSGKKGLDKNCKGTK